MKFTIHQLNDYLVAQEMDYGTESISQLLYRFYAENHITNSPAIQELYDALVACTNGLSPQEQNGISDILCDLCNEHEKVAFVEGLTLGAKLNKELCD